MLRPGTFALTLLLSFLTALGPLSMDMYLPSLPDIGRTLHASTLHVQLTISSYLFGFAVGQIFYGPVSDRFGRKPVLLAALVLYAFATIGCASAQSIDALIGCAFSRRSAAPARSSWRAPWCAISIPACARGANCR